MQEMNTVPEQGVTNIYTSAGSSLATLLDRFSRVPQIFVKFLRGPHRRYILLRNMD